MQNVKGNNNLRDFYYRDIVLGEQKEKVYESTNNYEIALDTFMNLLPKLRRNI